jgi:hypothetical protein
MNCRTKNCRTSQRSPSAAVDLLFHRKGKNKERSLIGLSQNERNEEEINQCCMSQQIINLFLLLLKSRLTKNS